MAAAVCRPAPNSSQTKSGMQARRTRVMALGTVRIRSTAPSVPSPGEPGSPTPAAPGGRVAGDAARWSSVAPPVESLIGIPLACSPTPFTGPSLRAGPSSPEHPLDLGLRGTGADRRGPARGTHRAPRTGPAREACPLVPV